MLGQLLEWSPTVIATPRTAEKLAASGIKLDYIIGKTDVAIVQSDINHIDQVDDTATRTALIFLTDNGYPSVNIITDDVYLDAYEPFLNLINLVIFYRHEKIYAVNPGFSKWQPAEAVIKILSRVTNLQFTGLQSIDHRRFVTTDDGFFTLWFDNQFIFVAEEV